MSIPITCTVWHPYPTYRWEYKQSGDWESIVGYALYESGYDSKTVHLADTAVEGNEAKIRCVIYNPDGVREHLGGG